MERVEVVKAVHGIVHMIVCALKDATDKEILAVCQRDNPSGTQNGWTSVIRADEEYPRNNPVVCSEHPGRLHFMVSC